MTFARTAGLVDLWARASHNLGVIELRSGRYDEASRTLDEALRLSAEAQQTEIQLGITYNLGHLAREQGDFQRAGEIYELATELAERIGQSEIKAGALASMGLCRLELGDVEEASRLNEQLQPLAARLPDWFQGRELVEALPIYLALRRSHIEAYERFTSALALAEKRDIYGASWLVAEFGLALREHAPGLIDGAVRRYHARPELRETVRIRDRFGVLLLDSPETVDREGK